MRIFPEILGKTAIFPPCNRPLRPNGRLFAFQRIILRIPKHHPLSCNGPSLAPLNKMERKTKGEVLRNANGTKGNRLGEKKADFLLPKQAQGIIRRTVFRDETKRGSTTKNTQTTDSQTFEKPLIFFIFPVPSPFPAENCIFRPTNYEMF